MAIANGANQDSPDRLSHASPSPSGDRLHHVAIAQQPFLPDALIPGINLLVIAISIDRGGERFQRYVVYGIDFPGTTSD